MLTNPLFLLGSQNITIFRLNIQLRLWSIRQGWIGAIALTLVWGSAYPIAGSEKTFHKGIGNRYEDGNFNRTPEQIPSEVNFIKEQSSKMLLGNAVGIGGCLTETKELVPHGEWLKWLTESVSYSPRRGREGKWCIDAPFDFNSTYTVF